MVPKKKKKTVVTLFQYLQ